MRVAETIFEVKEQTDLPPICDANTSKNYLSDTISQIGKVVSFSIKYYILYFADVNFETPLYAI